MPAPPSTFTLASAWAAALAHADAPAGNPWALPRDAGRRVPGLRTLPRAARLGAPALEASLAGALARDPALASLAGRAAATTDTAALAAVRAAALLAHREAAVGGGGGGGDPSTPPPPAAALAAAWLQAAKLDARTVLARAEESDSLASAVGRALAGAAAEAAHVRYRRERERETKTAARARVALPPPPPPPPPPSLSFPRFGLLSFFNRTTRPLS